MKSIIFLISFIFCFSIKAQKLELEPVNLWYDNTPMNDSKVDNIIYFKQNSKYFKRNTDLGYNVKWFGALGNGLHDDSDAFQKALNFIKKQNPLENMTGGWNYGGGKLMIPSGKYRITKKIEIPHNITIDGGVTNSTLIIGQTPIVFTNLTGIENGRDLLMSRSITIKNLFINGGGIELIGAYDSTLSNVKIFNTPLGIDVSLSTNLKIRDVQVYNCKNGIVLRGNMGSGHSTTTYLDNVWVAHCSEVGLSVLGIDYNLVAHNIRNSIFEYNGIGVKVKGKIQQLQFDNIHLEGNKSYNFLIEDNAQATFRSIWTDSSKTFVNGSNSSQSKLYFEHFNDELIIDKNYTGEITTNVFVKKLTMTRTGKFKFTEL